MTIVETRPITGGVDTHLDVHVAAALDGNGGVLGVESFPTTTAGFAELHAWLASFGTLDRVGVEGTGAYGAGLARFLRGDGRGGDRGRTVRTVRPAARHGKSDSIDAIEAARAALSGRARGSGQDRRRQRGSDPGAAGRLPLRARHPHQVSQPAPPSRLLRPR